jgi:hypothetical protein
MSESPTREESSQPIDMGFILKILNLPQDESKKRKKSIKKDLEAKHRVLH